MTAPGQDHPEHRHPRRRVQPAAPELARLLASRIARTHNPELLLADQSRGEPALDRQAGEALLQEDAHLVHEAVARIHAEVAALELTGLETRRAVDVAMTEVHSAWPALMAAVLVYLERWAAASRNGRHEDLLRDLPDRCPYCPTHLPDTTQENGDVP